MISFALYPSSWDGQSSRPPYSAFSKGRAGEVRPLPRPHGWRGQHSASSLSLFDPNPSLHGAMEMPTKSSHNTRIALQALQGACSKSFLEREFWVPPKWPLASVVVMSLLLKTHRMALTGNHHCTLLRALASASWSKLRAHLVSEAAQHYGVPRPSG